MNKRDPLQGRAILVTGAGRGLGRAYAIDSARAGAAVVVNDVDECAAEAVAVEIIRDGGSAVAHSGSVADWAVAEGAVATCLRRFGHIDGLVNNAGVNGRVTDLTQTSADDIRSVFEVNALGTFFCAVHAARAMESRHRGAIINVTSGVALGRDSKSDYAATKGAVLSMTYCWALELAPHGIRVNAISPRARTPMVLAGDPESRFPPPEETAPLVTFMLSDYFDLTGQVVLLWDGELSFLSPPMKVSNLQRRDKWTFRDVHAAFQDLRRDAQPVGRDASRYTLTPSLRQADE